MKNTLKRNLLIGFGASLLILILTSVASYVSINNLLHSSEMVNHTHDVIGQLHEIREALVDAETGQRGYLLTGNSEFLAPYTGARTRVTKAYETARTLTMDNTAQQITLTEMYQLLEKRFYYLKSTVDEFNESKTVTTLNLQKGREVMVEIRELIQIMEDREIELLSTRTQSLKLFSNYTPVLIVVGSIVALLITVLFYVRVRNDFDERTRLQEMLEQKDLETSRRINIIRGIADQVAQGSYSVRVNDQQSDALGNVAGALNKMASSLEHSFSLLSDKEWMQAGLSKLSEAMIGEKPLDMLARQLVDFVAAYTNSHAAVLYILDRDELSAAAAYALAPARLNDRFRIGEGLVGQAVANGKTLEIKDIPAEQIYVSFASGEARPAHVVAVPVFDGYTIKGAIELATLHRFSERELEFLSKAAHNIGIAITTAQNRKRLQELLEETQSQAEELKAQHSELENLNAELEVQAEKLQTSEEELKVQQEELQQANQELEERSRSLEEKNILITERNIEIQNKAEQLAQSTRYKSEFLANMSHELRTPLNSILLLSRLMGENNERNLTPDQIEYAKVIQSSGTGLLSLIDEILDLSKIEAGKMQLEYQHVDVREVVAAMQAMFSPLAMEKRIVFDASLAQDVPPTIETDRMRLEQVLRNLLGNAVKFTAQGSVRMAVALNAQKLQYMDFTVTDTGIGIAPEKQALVFEAFQQADGSTRRKYGGTGLGLSISRELAKLLGGEISLKSEPGVGSEFTVTIPVSRAALQKAREVEEIVQEVGLPISAPSMPAAEAHQYISTVIPENIPDDRDTIREGDKVILIIEDDVNFAKSLLEYTHKRNYKGIVAVRGDEGIMLAKQFRPSGILLDIQLPVKSGWDVMEELKNSTETRHIPVHIMSSYELKSESLLKGAVDFINKPVAFDQMQDIFRKIEYMLTHHPKKVLIVEENAKHAKALAYYLETFDVSLDITNQVEQAIDALRNKNVDCVILDMGIPDQKAYDTLDAVKKTQGLENLPIIVFTGKSLSPTEERKIKKYADSIVVKTAHSYKRILDEVSLFLHLVENTQKPAVAKYHTLGAMDEVLKGKTVLIADDDMRNIFSLTKALEKYQMTVIAAIDGRDALQKLHDNPQIDIVLMDMMMPEMDGYESTAAIRRDVRFRDLPIIAVTAKAMIGDRAKCINAGASDYITKPVDVDQLFSLLRVWLYERVKK